MKFFLVLCAFVGLSATSCKKIFIQFWKLYPFILIFLSIPVAVANSEQRIVGGTDAVLGQFPYQVSLRNFLGAHFCGGFIHSNRWIISAAHCTIGRGTGNTRVVVGTITTLITTPSMPTDLIVNHPNYNPNTLANDISLVRTSANIIFNALVQPIPLSTSNIQGQVSAVASGWGFLLLDGIVSNKLKFLNVQTINLEICRARLSTANRANVFDSNICTTSPANTGMCQGDSGGPLVANGEVIGVISWGISCAQNFPDVFTRVSSHVGFINAMINQYGPVPI